MNNTRILTGNHKEIKSLPNSVHNLKIWFQVQDEKRDDLLGTKANKKQIPLQITCIYGSPICDKNVLTVISIKTNLNFDFDFVTILHFAIIRNLHDIS